MLDLIRSLEISRYGHLLIFVSETPIHTSFTKKLFWEIAQIDMETEAIMANYKSLHNVQLFITYAAVLHEFCKNFKKSTFPEYILATTVISTATFLFQRCNRSETKMFIWD